MEDIVNIIVGSSTTFDVYVLVRIIVLMIILEMVSLICSYLGGLKK